MARNLNWFQARALARQGKAIRREAWRKWLIFGLALRYISKIVSGAEQRYVVPNLEFRKAESLAKDWTDEPWDNAPAPVGVTAPPGTPGHPSSGGGGGGSESFDPPGGGPPGGGGGGGPGGGPNEPRQCPNGYHLEGADPVTGFGGKCVKDQGEGNDPNITVTINPPDSSGYSNFDDGRNCFTPDSQVGGGGNQHSADISVSINIAGGPPRVGTMTVQLQGTTKGGMTGWPGMNQDVQFNSIQFTPGSQITATVNYTIEQVTHTGTGTYTFPNYCKKRGCMDPIANNYDDEAEEDDGSCTFDVPGCTNPSAKNYNPNATVDDGSCQFCPSGQHWDGNACVPDDPPQCPAGQHWNGSTCVPDDDGSSNGSVGGSQM